MGGNLEEAPTGSGYAVARPKDNASDPGIIDGTGAHGAGFHGHIKWSQLGASAGAFTGFPDDKDFCMGRGIMRSFPPVMVPGNDASILDENGPTGISPSRAAKAASFRLLPYTSFFVCCKLHGRIPILSGSAAAGHRAFS